MPAIMEKNTSNPAPSIPALYTPLCNFVENAMFIINDFFLEMVLLHPESVYIGCTRNIIINTVLHMERIFLTVFVARALTGS